MTTYIEIQGDEHVQPYETTQASTITQPDIPFVIPNLSPEAEVDWWIAQGQIEEFETMEEFLRSLE